MPIADWYLNVHIVMFYCPTDMAIYNKQNHFHQLLQNEIVSDYWNKSDVVGGYA